MFSTYQVIKEIQVTKSKKFFIILKKYGILKKQKLLLQVLIFLPQK